MEGDRKPIRVGDLVRSGVLALNDGYRMRNEELGTTGTPFVRGGDIGDGSIDHRTVDHIRPEFQSRIASKLTQPWDVAFITKGTVGRVGILRPEQPPVVFAPQVAYWRSLDTDVLWPRFIYYLLKGPAFQACLDADKTHGAMVADYVSLSQQHDFTVLLPPVTEQRAIARILGALDDKIEANRRMKETLEAMARALFKSWFVDFDPVRAKAERRRPGGMDAETAKVFPSEFEMSELGEIPRGWRVAPLGDLIELKRGYDLPSAQRQAGRVPIISSSGPTGLHSASKARAPGVVTGRYGTIGKVFFVHEDYWPLNTTLYVRDFKGTDALYAYHLLALLDFNKFSDKAAVPGVNRNHLHQEQVVIPPVEVQARFAELAGSWLDQAAVRANESTTLVALRDGLLPRLLDGEIRLDVAITQPEARV